MKKIKWLSIPLAFMLVVLAGCQSVGGLDISKALANNINPVSSESRQTLSVEVVPVEGALSISDRVAIELINSFSLNIEQAKVEDSQTVSIKGDVQLSGQKTPFLVSMDEQGIGLEIEGAKQPLYISQQQGIPGLLGTNDLNAMNEESQELTVQVGEFIFKHFPNPSVLSVKQGQAEVNGEKLNLTHLHTEIRGDEFFGLVKPFLANASKDEQGLKALIEGYYDLFAPYIYMFDEEYVEGPDSKQAAVEEFYAELKAGLDEILASYDTEVKNLLEEDPDVATIFGKDTVLKLDLYFDGKLNLRKQTMDLNIALPSSNDLPISAVKVHSDSEVWNIGGAVKADKVDTSKGVLDFTVADPTPGQILRNFEDVPALYEFLDETMSIGYKTAFIDTESDYYGVIKKEGTAFIPLRFFADELDADIKWTKDSPKRFVVTDDITGKEIVLEVGSSEALVDGAVVKLKQPMFIHTNGSGYVPLRFMAEALGAELDTEMEGWIMLTRD